MGWLSYTVLYACHGFKHILFTSLACIIVFCVFACFRMCIRVCLQAVQTAAAERMKRKKKNKIEERIKLSEFETQQVNPQNWSVK